MSARSVIAIIWGIVSLVLLGINFGIGFAGKGGSVDGFIAFMVFVGAQVFFAAISVGYTAGREDQHRGRVHPKDTWRSNY